MPPTIKKALESIGLGDKETRVLLVLLENGPMFAAAVARAAKLNRTTTYGILKELASKGLVSSSSGAATKYQSIAPELLPAYIERRGNELLEIKNRWTNSYPRLNYCAQRERSYRKSNSSKVKKGGSRRMRTSWRIMRAKNCTSLPEWMPATTRLARSSSRTT